MAHLDLGNCKAVEATFLETELSKNFPQSASTRMYGHTAVLLGHRVFAFGGYSDFAAKKRIYVYDTSENKWSAVVVENTQAVYGNIRFSFVHCDKIFSFCRSFSGNTDRANLVEFDVLMMEGFTQLDVKQVDLSNGKFIVGGYHESTCKVLIYNGRNVTSFDVDGKRFTSFQTKGVSPGLLYKFQSCCVTETKMVVANDSLGQVALHVLELASRTWTMFTPRSTYTPPAIWSYTISYVPGRIYIMGGYSKSGFAARNMDVFDVKEKRWYCIASKVAVPPEHRMSIVGSLGEGTRVHAAVHSPEKIIYFGGFGSSFHIKNPLIIRPLS